VKRLRNGGRIIGEEHGRCRQAPCTAGDFSFDCFEETGCTAVKDLMIQKRVCEHERIDEENRVRVHSSHLCRGRGDAQGGCRPPSAGDRLRFPLEEPRDRPFEKPRSSGSEKRGGAQRHHPTQGQDPTAPRRPGVCGRAP
jgi:hypothetical protein